jgi:hypothetical protein
MVAFFAAVQIVLPYTPELDAIFQKGELATCNVLLLS